MRSRLSDSKILVMTVLIIVMLVEPTVAITNPGLYWGVEIGDRFDYHRAVRYTDPNENSDLDYYVVIDSLPIIPDNITVLPYVSSSSANEWNIYFSFYFTNNTEITSQTRVPALPWSAFPIGNWSFVEECILSDINTTYWEVHVIDTETEWGFSLTADEGIWIHTDTTRYSKVDGALNFFEMDFQYHDGRFRKIDYIRVGEGIPLQLVIGIFGVSIGLMVIAVVVYKKRS